MALGAGSLDVVRLVLGQSLWLTAAGILIGLAGSQVLTHFLSSLLFGVKASDPVTFIVVAVTLTIVALVASFVPAYRAATIDPVEALRQE
jgi:ABC-type antimicrobial peptide transport system permease subunit